MAVPPRPTPAPDKSDDLFFFACQLVPPENEFFILFYIFPPKNLTLKQLFFIPEIPTVSTVGGGPATPTPRSVNSLPR